MHGRRGHMDPLFELGDPFAGFGGLRGHQSLVSGIFEGRDPFDHPFFTDPFGGLSELHPFGLSGGRPLMNTHPSGFQMGGSPFMNSHRHHFPIEGGPFMHAHPPGFPIGMHPFMNAHPPNFPIGGSPFPRSHLPFGFGTEIPEMNVQPSDFQRKSSQTNRYKGPIIEELNSDDEKETEGKEEKRDNSRKHDRSKKEAYVEDQDYQTEGRNKKQILCCNENRSVNNNTQACAQGHSFTFQSSTVMHGGANGAYYTKSKTMRTGSDGLTIDESKEADSTTGRAAHRLSRGIHDKGHTVTRNLQSDGKVDTSQILHNLDKDDLAGFEQTWNINARKSFPGYVQNGSGISAQRVPQSRGVCALPLTESPHISGSMNPGGGGRSGSSEIQNHGRLKVKDGDRANSSCGRF